MVGRWSVAPPYRSRVVPGGGEPGANSAEAHTTKRNCVHEAPLSCTSDGQGSLYQDKPPPSR